MNKLTEARLIIDKEDEIIREAFIKRMKAVEKVIEYKKEENLPIFDAKREALILEKAKSLINDPKLEPYYLDLVKALMTISKAYQKELLDE